MSEPVVIGEERTEIAGIQFQKLGKTYHFSIKGHDDVALEDWVIVETKRGRQLGQVNKFVSEEETRRRRGIKPIVRKATPRELVLQQIWQGKELDALITSRERAHKQGVRGVKFVKAQYNYDGSWLTILYTTEDKNTNLGKLRSSLSRSLRTRVEMQLIGPRDVAKILGGYGACGGPRCCSTFLTEFSPVSIRMAKEQGISLSPSEITGMCGRLRCCLVYEYEQYVAAKKRLPKVRQRVGTPHGEGVVRDVRVLRDSVLVNVGNEYHEVAREDIQPLEELAALKAKAEAGCSKHEGGGCECGARDGAKDGG